MKDLTACCNLINVLYSYAFQLRDEIIEIEGTIFDMRNVLLEFYDRIPDEEHFSILIKNIKLTLELMNQIFICNELKFKQWSKEDQINLFEHDFLLKQQKEQIEKEYLKHSYLMECFENDHADALDFWKTNFGEAQFVFITQFFDALQKDRGQLDSKTKNVMMYYIDFTKDNLVGIFKYYKFLNYFGNFNNFVENIQCLISKDLYIYSMSSIKANPKLRHSKKGTYIIRFSKSHSNCFAISFKNEKHDIKQFLLFCSKNGLKLKHSEKIYPNLCDFIQSNSSVLRYPADKDEKTIFGSIIHKNVPNNNSITKQKICGHCKGVMNDSV